MDESVWVRTRGWLPIPVIWKALVTGMIGAMMLYGGSVSADKTWQKVSGRSCAPISGSRSAGPLLPQLQRTALANAIRGLASEGTQGQSQPMPVRDEDIPKWIEAGLIKDVALEEASYRDPTLCITMSGKVHPAVWHVSKGQGGSSAPQSAREASRDRQRRTEPTASSRHREREVKKPESDTQPRRKVRPTVTPAATTPRGHLTFSVGTWISEGRSRWNHNANVVDPLLGNPSSELDYQDLSSTIVEFTGQLTGREGGYLRANFGTGDITGGRLVDDDYVSALGASFFGTTVSGEHRFSRTFSEVDGNNLWYLNIDLGHRLTAFSERHGGINSFVGFQFWREQATASGLTQVECTAPGVLCDPVGTVAFVGQPVITNTVKWYSARVGVEGDYRHSSGLGFDAMVAGIPYSWMENEDIHHLRTGLEQDPSFSMSGQGYGVNLEAGLSYLLFRRLELRAGYRFWWLRVQDGTWQSHPVGSAPLTAILNELETQRHGGVFSVGYTF